MEGHDGDVAVGDDPDLKTFAADNVVRVIKDLDGNRHMIFTNALFRY